jgi:hypothetical protein
MSLVSCSWTPVDRISLGSDHGAMADSRSPISNSTEIVTRERDIFMKAALQLIDASDSNRSSGASRGVLKSGKER